MEEEAVAEPVAQSVIDVLFFFFFPFSGLFEPSSLSQAQNEEAYILEYLHIVNRGLALTCELLLPELGKSAALPQAVYTVLFHLRSEIEAFGVPMSFTRFLADIETSFQQYFEGYAELVGQFTVDQLRAVHPESSKLSLGELLELPLAIPLIFSNMLIGLRSKTKDETLDASISKLQSIRLLSNTGEDDAKIKKALEAELQPSKTGFLHDLFRRPASSQLSAGPRAFLGKVEALRMVLPQQPGRARDVKLLVFSDLVLVVARELPTLLYRLETRSVVASPRLEPGLGDAAANVDASFSLFWNRGEGKLEHFVFFAGSRQAAQLALARLHTVALLSHNSEPSAALRVLTRERKPFQGYKPRRFFFWFLWVSSFHI
jgi:hypothetical protein